MSNNAADISYALYAAQQQRAFDVELIADLRESLAIAWQALEDAAVAAEKWHRLATGLTAS
jgi:hypothetical protein